MLTILKVKITANKNYRNSALQKQMTRCFLSLTVTLLSVKKEAMANFISLSIKSHLLKFQWLNFMNIGNKDDNILIIAWKNCHICTQNLMVAKLGPLFFDRKLTWFTYINQNSRHASLLLKNINSVWQYEKNYLIHGFEGERPPLSLFSSFGSTCFGKIIDFL